MCSTFTPTTDPFGVCGLDTDLSGVHKGWQSLFPHQPYGMPTSAGLTIKILCDGKALEEYPREDEQSTPRTSSCWIASQEGKVRVFVYICRSILIILEFLMERRLESRRQPSLCLE